MLTPIVELCIPRTAEEHQFALKRIAEGIGKDRETGLLVMDHYCALCRDFCDGEAWCEHKAALAEMEAV